MAYRDAASRYLARGWAAPIPLDGKILTTTGVTGAEGVDPTPEQVEQWRDRYPAWNIGIRMPANVIGIDVDRYTKTSTTGKVTTKRGDVTLAAKVQEWGELPATWTSTARGQATPSRIHFYRIEPQRLAANIVPDIEIVQRHHRYAVVAPSTNPDTGTPYCWYGPDGNPSETPPSPDDLPMLPADWVKGLSNGASAVAPERAPAAHGYALLAAIEADTDSPCYTLAKFLDATAEAIEDVDTGSRHDLTTARVMSLVMQAAEGHTGAGTALAELRDAWESATAGEDRTDEFERMVTSAAQRAVTAIGSTEPKPHADLFCRAATEQIQREEEPAIEWTEDEEAYGSDDLDWYRGAYEGSDEYEAPDPTPQADHTPVPVDSYLSDLLEHIGTDPFDPQSVTDTDIAEAAGRRLSRFLRRLSSGVWIERGPEKWAETDDAVTTRVLVQLGKMVPRGEEYDGLRSKLANAKKRAGVEHDLRAHAGGRGDPLFCEAESVVGDPHVIWTGGRCVDLRRSQEKLTYTSSDVIHMQTTRYVADPECPTPRFDALCDAVWPDADVRAYALRVLSVAFTGEASAVLAVLHGPGGSGKTSIAETLNQVLGDYGHTLEASVLHGENQKHGTYLYSLKGKRLAYVDEGPAENKVGIERLKQMTGGSKIQANRMRKDTEEFSPSHTLVMTTNNEPILTDPAMMRRVRLIPCNTPEELVRPARAALGTFTDPKAAIHEEGPGILAKMLREAARWLADRESSDLRQAPESVRTHTETVREEQDVVGQFLTELTRPVDPTENGVQSSKLYRVFKHWCTEEQALNERYVLSQRRFSMALQEKGVTKVRTTAGRYFSVGLNKSANHLG